MHIMWTAIKISTKHVSALKKKKLGSEALRCFLCFLCLNSTFLLQSVVHMYFGLYNSLYF